jgi:tetratricopeptide (TPR) repeat protein
VALRPFTFSGDTAYAWVAQTFADGLVPGLLKVEGLIVKPPAQVEVARASDAVEIGQLLKVDAVLSGDVQVRGNFVRVVGRLTSVADGAVRWQGHLDGELEVDGAPQDIYRITDSLAVEIIAALRPELSRAGRAVAERGLRTTNLEALALYQRARTEAGVSRTPASWIRAKELLERALELDPSFADAMVLLHEATVSSMLGSGQTAAQIVTAVDGLLDRAIRTDSMNGMAWAVRGRFRAAFKWEWDESIADYRRAVALSPSSPDVLWEYAFSLNERDQRDSAIFYARRAFALSETNSLSLHDLSVVLYFAGRADSAFEAARIGLQLDPPMQVLLDRGRRAEADSMAAKYLNLGGYCCTQSLAYAAAYFQRSGDAARAQEMLDSMRAHARRGTVPGSELATAYLAVGNRPKALDELERALRERDNMLPNNLWLLLSPLGGEPRYEAVFRGVYGDRPSRRQTR